jgi:antirestriction protein
MAEVTLHCEGKWALMFMGKVIALDKVGDHDNFQFNTQCNVTSAMTLLPFIMVPVKCPNLRKCAVFDIVKTSGDTTEIR